jgi:hypothetical protein
LLFQNDFTLSNQITTLNNNGSYASINLEGDIMKRMIVIFILILSLVSCDSTKQPNNENNDNSNEDVYVIDSSSFNDFIEYNEQEFVVATHFETDNWLSNGTYSFYLEITYLEKYVVCYEIETGYFHLYLWDESADSNFHMIYYEGIYYVRANGFGGLTRVYIVGRSITWGDESYTLSTNQQDLYNDFKVLISTINSTQ